MEKLSGAPLMISKLAEMIQNSEDDGDPDWIPEQLQRKVLRRAANLINHKHETHGCRR